MVGVVVAGRASSFMESVQAPHHKTVTCPPFPAEADQSRVSAARSSSLLSCVKPIESR